MQLGYVAMLVGRDAEFAALAGLIDQARTGGGAALVLKGEAGVGKTALLDAAIQIANGFVVSRTEGIESELQFGYAALHRILLPFMDRVDQLPSPQKDAVGAVFGLSSSGPPDRLLVGLATLTLLGDPDRAAPLLVAIDDAQWIDLDSMAVLGFVGRRLQADGVALLFAVRDPVVAELPIQGLPELEIHGLASQAARELLSSLTSTPLDDQVVVGLVSATRGNPLALTGITQELSALQLAGLEPLPDPLPAGEMIEARFARQVEALPPQTRLALLLAAAEPSKDAVTIAKAAQQLGISLEALEEPEALGLVSTANAIEFRHPLIRSAVYASASPSSRRSVHGALAAATDARTNRHRWAMHRALASVGPDEEVAAALEESATEARAKGGYISEASLLTRAARLTPGERECARRFLGAAHAALVAGNLFLAMQLIEDSRRGSLNQLEEAQAQVLEGSIRHTQGQGGKSEMLLFEAAKSLSGFDRNLSRHALLSSFNAMLTTSVRAQGITGREIAEFTLSTLRDGPGDPEIDSLLRGLASVFVCDHAEAARAVRESLATLESMSPSRLCEWVHVSVVLPQELWDPDAYGAVLERLERASRALGSGPVLKVALVGLASKETKEGNFAAARSLHEEQIDVTRATSGLNALSELLDVELVAWQGPENQARAKAIEYIKAGESFNSGSTIQYGRYCLALLELSVGRYHEALGLARAAANDGTEVWWHYLVLPLLIETATRCEDFDTAARALDEIEKRARALDTPYATGLMWRCRALVWDGERAKAAFESALKWLDETPWRTELARTHLLFGEWLRREKLITEARVQLRTAYHMFDSMGAQPFADRAKMELQAFGERVRKRNVKKTTDLTARELQIARLAAQRLTSREVAARLFISPHTVEYHLKKVFQKLGVNSRRDLLVALSPEDVIPA